MKGRRWRCLSFALGCLWVIILTGPSQAESPLPPISPGAAVHDLTHPLEPTMPIWPGGVPFELTRLSGYERIFYSQKFSMGEHTGTHIDAPAHTAPGKPTVDAIPLKHLIVPAVVIDVRQGVRGDPDYAIGPADIINWERSYGAIPVGSVVLALTGWSSRWPDQGRYRNADGGGIMHFPGFSKEGARFLVEEREVVGLGIDTLSLDPGVSADFPVHRQLFAASRYGLENLTGLEALPPAGATLIVAPLKIKGGSGAPVRVFALVP